MADVSVRPRNGFSLLELIVVMTLIGLLVAIALPAYTDATQKAKEAVLKEDLQRLREALEEYFTDRGEYPLALLDLVEGGYLRAIPIDPITGATNTWVVEYAPWQMVDEGQVVGIWNVRSGARGVGLDGTPYSSW